MNRVTKWYTALICAVVVTSGAMAYTWTGGTALGDDTKHQTPTKLVMQVISSHTSKIMDALFRGDDVSVLKEANALAMSSQNVMDNFFPQGGQLGAWFEETGRNPDDPVAVKAAKDEFEKYLTPVIDAAKNVAESAKTEDIVKTFKVFNDELMKSCFDCHEAFRPKWPEWGDWMTIAGG